MTVSVNIGKTGARRDAAPIADDRRLPCRLDPLIA